LVPRFHTEIGRPLQVVVAQRSIVSLSLDMEAVAKCNRALRTRSFIIPAHSKMLELRMRGDVVKFGRTGTLGAEDWIALILDVRDIIMGVSRGAIASVSKSRGLCPPFTSALL
jgi:hypothetical protein